MKIAIASGKGGTGKTMLATSMALTLADEYPVWLVDCDVEAPNAHLFLHPEIKSRADAVVLIPKIDADACTACGICVKVCQFHALAKIGEKIMVFPQLCHGCGSCTINCPFGAITETSNPIGVIEHGAISDRLMFSQGTLTISEPMPTPIIRQLKKSIAPDPETIVFFDAPPGASCSVVETLRGADFVLLVAEPSSFGVHDLLQMVGIINDMQIPSGVVINRFGNEYSELQKILQENQIPILMKIPFSKKLAYGIAAGNTLVDVMPEYKQQFITMYTKIQELTLKEKFRK